jgi:putative transposase
MEGRGDILVNVLPLLEIVGDRRSFLVSPDETIRGHLRQHERTGRPLGSPDFIGQLEERLARKLKPQRPGPKKKDVKS